MTTEEIELPVFSKIVAAYPEEDKEKTIVIEFEKRAPNAVTQGRRLTTKTIGGVFSLMNKEGGLDERCFYDLSDGTPGVPLVIEGKLVLNLKNPIHFANYMNLKEYLKSFPDSNDGITIIDEVDNKKLSISNEEMLFMIKSRIIAMKNDDNALMKMYRRLIGSVMGITKDAIYAKLFEFTNEKPLDVAKYFETIGDDSDNIKSVLDLAIEKKVVAKSGETLLIVATNTIIGGSYEASVIRLREDSGLLADIQNAMKNVDIVKPNILDIKKDEPKMDSEKWDLEASVKSVVINTTSDNGEFHIETSNDQAMDDFIKNLQKNKIIVMGQNKKYNSELLPISETTKIQLADLFKKNTSLIKQAKAFLRQG